MRAFIRVSLDHDTNGVPGESPGRFVGVPCRFLKHMSTTAAHEHLTIEMAMLVGKAVAIGGHTGRNTTNRIGSEYLA